jgi:glycosyltransferase involved in cell wall biosynthesis
MQNSKTVTFVLPVYNGQADIAQCLDSLLKQENRGEIIVIDDASTDNTRRILAHYDGQIILFMNHERKGAAWCRNKGNSLALGDYVAVCDCDQYFPDRAKAICQFFATYKQYDVVYTANHLRVGREIVFNPAVEWDYNSKCPISHPTVAYRKSIAEKFKYHEKSIETDLYEFFLFDIHRAGHKFGWIGDSFMIKNEDSRKRDKTKADKLKAKMYGEYNVQL